MNKLTKIGWIGTGVMGKSMCKHLLKNGYDLSVFNRTPAKADELIQLGAKFLQPKEIAQSCDAVFLMLGYPIDVETMVLGEEGILNHMKKGSFLIDHTTSSPDLAAQIYTKALEKEVISYDAPVTGGDIGAREGRLVIMVGGDEQNFGTVQEIMKFYSSKIDLMGLGGQGQQTKMANQIMIAGCMIGTVEGMVYASKSGLNVEKMLALIGGGSAGSFSLNVYGPRIIKRDFEPGFYIEHFVKDLEICLKECEKMKLKLAGLELVHKLYKMLQDDGLGRKGTQALMLALEKLN